LHSIFPIETIDLNISLADFKASVAEQSLKAIRQQLGQIQNKVARKVLLTKSKEIAQNLAIDEFKVILFRTGSSGKTPIEN
jgi:uncharacterized protein